MHHLVHTTWLLGWIQWGNHLVRVAGQFKKLLVCSSSKHHNKHHYTTTHILTISNSTIHLSPLLQNIYDCTTIGQHICFYHGCLFFPPKSTWIKAIMAGYFQGWPNLTFAAVNRHIQVTSETTKEHLSQCRQGLQSTKFGVEPSTNAKTNEVYIAIEMQPGKLYTDQTGWLPFTSNGSNAYYVNFYVYNTNAIIAELIKNCSHTELVWVYSKW